MRLHDVRPDLFVYTARGEDGTEVWTSDPAPNHLEVDWEYIYEYGDADEIRAHIERVKLEWPEGLVLHLAGYPQATTTKASVIADLEAQLVALQ